MKKFFAILKVLMMSLIVALFLFTATPFNESTAEASEVFAYSEGNIDYYVDTEVHEHSVTGYLFFMKARGSSYPPILTISYAFIDTNSEEDPWPRREKRGWIYTVVLEDQQWGKQVGHQGYLSENWKAQRVFNIVYPKILEKRRERREEKQRIAEEKRREEQRIAEEKRRKEDEFNSLVAQGDKFYADKNYTAAIQSYAKAEDLNTGLIYVFHRELVENGDKLSSQGNYSAALDYYKKALTMNSSDSNCHDKLLDTYSKVRNFDDAVSFYEAMTTVYYKDYYYWFWLAHFYDELGNYENAITAYTNSIQFDPNYAWAYTKRGLAYNKLNQYERAIQDCNKAIQLNPDYAEAYICRGIAYIQSRQYEQAIRDFDKAIKLNPNYELAYSLRGLAYEHMKKYKKALKDYKKALELDPNNKNAQKGIERVSKTK